MIIFLSILLIFSVIMWLGLGIAAIRIRNGWAYAMGVPQAVLGAEAVGKWSTRYFFLALATVGLLIYFW